jgi:putative flippase GtrA
MQIDIETVYIAGNNSTHFRMIRDSVLVYLPFFKFCFTGISSAVVDYVLLFVFQWLTNNLLISVVAARVASSAVNYTINRYFVFISVKKARKTSTQLVYYYILVTILLAINYTLLRFLSQDLKINLFLSKVLTELALFCISYVVQHFIIFKKLASS